MEGAGQEACDGLDNDCDDQVDEVEELGTSTCGLGECEHTVDNCKDGVPQVCNPLEGAQAETCDGLDNNCNGDEDENLGTTTCGLGECEHTVDNCKDGVPQTCDPVEGAQEEVCFDDLDNDCDGDIADDADCVLASCQELHIDYPALDSGAYTIDPDGEGGDDPREVYCDMDFDGGGWTLVWKHSYYEVGAVSDDMRFYSSHYRECSDLDVGWCNIPGKLTIGTTEQMVMATHQGTVVYAYKGTLNSKLDSSWDGAILASPTNLVDKCVSQNGHLPEPEKGGHAYLGVTFDKANNGNYTSNCDTDRYGENGSDCRWENCTLPGNISSQSNHTQMTVLIFVR